MNKRNPSLARPSDIRAARRPTIGLLTANIHTGASRQLWPGVLDAAAAGDASLVCYPGGRLRTTENFEDQRNFTYDLLHPEAFDGLISWTSALSGALTAPEVEEFHQKYQPLPIVSLAAPLSHSSLVSIDGYRGMRALIFHLLDVHNHQRIALIRGPEGHPYAQERYQAFNDALRERGLVSGAELITPYTSWENGAEAIRVLLDERHLKPGRDFQAIVATSDLLAIGALGILSERGIRVPADVAVVGFNDIEEGRLVRPPLTSVSLPFYEQGRRAVETLLSTLSGKQPPGQIILESRLLVRQSCGCPSQSVNLAVAEQSVGDNQNLKRALKQAQEQLFEQITQVISNRGLASTWAKQLMDSFYNEISTPRHGQFRATLDSMLQQGVLDGDETAAWQSAISVIRRELLSALEPPLQLRAEDLFGQARVVIGEAIQRAQNTRRLRSEHQTQILGEIGQALITTFDIDKLAEVLAERLEDLGIQSCYLACLEKPYHKGGFARLVLAYTDGKRADLGPSGRRFPAQQLIPAELLPERRYSLLVEPLFFRNEPLGYVVFEVGLQEGAIYEVLRGHISSALKGAMLFQEAYEARLAAERADKVKTRLLANVSHELRTPLNIIIGHSQRLLETTPSGGLARDLQHIQASATHQLRIINDLLDLSRAEINALDLYPVLLEPKNLVEEAFAALAGDAERSNEVTWRLELPEHLPPIEADPVRLRQILLNLLSNAAKFTKQGQITLGAEVATPYLHLWVADTGIGIPIQVAERIYEPFFTSQQSEKRAGGIGLGLTITQHLVKLHQGFLDMDSQVGKGTTFHIYLPLPRQDEPRPLPKQKARPGLWLVSSAGVAPAEIATFAASHDLEIEFVRPSSDIESLLAGGLPRVVAWDFAEAASGNWVTVRRLQNHPDLSEVPFLLLRPGEESAGGLTSFVVKPANARALWRAIRPAIPLEATGSVLIIDDEAQARQVAYEVIKKGLPGYAIRIAEDGAAGLAAAQADPPDLVILDLMMPGLDGFEVLDRLRADERTRQVPVIILSGRQLSLGDVRRLEQHASVLLHSKGILSEDEIIATLHRSLFSSDTLPPQTSALAKRAIAYLHQNFSRPLARWEIAGEIGVSEDYLSRVFKRELGITPWDYLNRFRVAQAREMLRITPDSISDIAGKIGFSDAAYFSRVFRQIIGVSPSAFRDQPD